MIRLNNWRWCLLLLLLCGGSSHAAQGQNEPEKMLNVFTCYKGEQLHFYAQNLQVAAVTTTFDMQLTNMTGSTHFPFTTTLAGTQTVELFTLAPLNHELEYNYSYINSTTIGSADAVPDDTWVYALPYAPGSSFLVSQGYHGTFSHTGPDEYAIDWKMPVGTPVYAAREGLVVESKDDSNRGGPWPIYQNCANRILIQHPDGTVGIYGHLKQGGNKVKVGERVSTGDLIGLSGKTGYANGPHLHFAVFKVRNGAERVSLPVKFRTADNPELTLVSGQTYKAAPDDRQQRQNTVFLATAGPMKP